MMRLLIVMISIAMILAVHPVAWSQEIVEQAEAGKILFDEGIEGLKRLLQRVGAPPLTFDQEAQIRNLHDVYQREARRILEERPENVETLNRTLTDQLFLGAAKLLNPVQRDALGAVVDTTANTDLPSDPDELREYLRDLTSPAADGDDDDDIVINGFSGGRMPNRDEILEIRINDNAFTAEQSNQGRGRTEIRTRGGTGQFNGDAEFQFEDESLNARNAFSSSRPPYQTRDFEANVSGPFIRNRLTATLGIANDVSEEGDTLRAITPEGLINSAISRPSVERGLNMSATTQLSENHALTFSYAWGNSRSDNNNVGGFGLPEQGTDFEGSEYNFQIQETAVLTPTINHEVRFRISRETEAFLPLNNSPHIVVRDAFEGGGATGNESSTDRELEFGNLMMYTGRSVSIKTGFDGSYQRETSQSRDNFNGTFTFATLEDYVARRPFQYSVNQGNPDLSISQFDAAAFLQTDFRVTPRLTLGLGARYEAQTRLSDWNNLDPRLGFAYHFGGTTVLRGGTGIFHQRVQIWQFQDALRFDGERQRSIIITNPSYPDPSLTGELTVRLPSSIRSIDDDLAAPYSWNSELSLESTLPMGLVLTGSYQFVRGVHLLRGRNINAPLDTTSPVPRSCRPEQSAATCQRPVPTSGNIVQMESTGLSRTHAMEIGFQQRLRFLNIRGTYTARSSYDDVPGGAFGLPADNYDMSSEWGPQGSRHSLDTSVNLRMPWNIDADLGFNWDSGQPYSLVTGRDDNKDTNTTDRPEGVHRNSLTGPSFFEVDLGFSKTVNLLPEDANTGAEGPVAGGGYFGRRRGVRMTIAAEAENLLNKVNASQISGVLTSPFFGKPIRARDGRQVSLSLQFNF